MTKDYLVQYHNPFLGSASKIDLIELYQRISKIGRIIDDFTVVIVVQKCHLLQSNSLIVYWENPINKFKYTRKGLINQN